MPEVMQVVWIAWDESMSFIMILHALSCTIASCCHSPASWKGCPAFTSACHNRFQRLSKTMLVNSISASSYHVMMFSFCWQVFITLRMYVSNMMCNSDPLTVACFSLVPGAGCLRWLARTSAKLQFARQRIEPRCLDLNSKMYEYFHGLWMMMGFCKKKCLKMACFPSCWRSCLWCLLLGSSSSQGKCHESHKWKIV